MSYGGPDDETLQLRVVYEASQVVKDAIADILELKERVGELNEANQLQLETLKRYDEELDKAKESLKAVSEATENLATEQKKLTQGTLEFTEVLQLQGDRERDLSTLSQEVLKRMRERQDAQAGVNRVIEETIEDLKAQEAEEERLADIVAKNALFLKTQAAEAAAEAAAGYAKLSQNAFMAERALTALGTGHGVARVGPMLEKIIGSAGGPAGIGFGIAGLAFLLETIGPKVKGFLESWAEASGIIDTTEHVKAMADELERALKASEALDKTPTVQEAKTRAAVKAAIVARGGETITGQIELGLSKTKQLEEYMTPQELERYQALPKEGLTPEFVQAEQEKILFKARAKRHEEASAWKGQLEGDKGSRQGLRALAKAAPGIISPLFLDELALAEPEAQVEIEQQKRAEMAAGKESTTWGNKRKKEIKAGKEWDKGNALQQRIDTQSAKEQEREWNRDSAIQYRTEDQIAHEDARIAAKAEAEHKKALHAKEQQAKKAAHERRPSVRAAHEEAEEKDMYLDAVQRSTHGFGGKQQQDIARHLQESYQRGYGFGNSFDTILADAIRQSNDQMERGIQARLKKQYSGGNARGD